MPVAKDNLFVICQHFQRTSSVKLLGQFQLNFMQPPGEEVKKVCIFGLDHMTNMAAMSICGKNLKNPSALVPLGRLP